MSTTVWIKIQCDHRDADGHCGSTYRAPGSVVRARHEAAGYGWQLGEVDLCPRCAAITGSTAEAR